MNLTKMLQPINLKTWPMKTNDSRRNCSISKTRKTASVERVHPKQIREAGLNPENPCHVSQLFLEQLQNSEDEKQRADLIADRAALILESTQVDSNPQNHQPHYIPATTSTLEQIDTKEFARRLLR